LGARSCFYELKDIEGSDTVEAVVVVVFFITPFLGAFIPSFSNVLGLLHCLLALEAFDKICRGLLRCRGYEADSSS
jgi:hypothetical protein